MVASISAVRVQGEKWTNLRQISFSFSRQISKSPGLGDLLNVGGARERVEQRTRGGLLSWSKWLVLKRNTGGGGRKVWEGQDHVDTLIWAAHEVEMYRRKLDAGCISLKLQGFSPIRKDPKADNTLSSHEKWPKEWQLDPNHRLVVSAFNMAQGTQLSFSGPVGTGQLRRPLSFKITANEAVHLTSLMGVQPLPSLGYFYWVLSMCQASRIRTGKKVPALEYLQGQWGQTHEHMVKIPHYRWKKRLGVNVQWAQLLFDFSVVNISMELVQILVGWFSFFILMNDVQSSQLQRNWDFNLSFKIFTFFNVITILTLSSY